MAPLSANTSLPSTQALLEMLDMLVAPETFDSDQNADLSEGATLEAYRQQIARVLPFEQIGVLMRDDDGLSFTLRHHWPAESSADSLQSIVDAHIDGGTFSLALQQNRPIVTQPDALRNRFAVLQALSTRQRIVGTLIAIAPPDC